MKFEFEVNSLSGIGYRKRFLPCLQQGLEKVTGKGLAWAKDFTPQPPLHSSPIPNSHGSFSGLTCCLLPSSIRFTSLASPPSRRVVASEVPPVLARLARASFPTCELLAVLILAYITRRNISTKPMIAWVSILFTEGSVLTNGLQEESETIMSLRLI